MSKRYTVRLNNKEVQQMKVLIEQGDYYNPSVVFREGMKELLKDMEVGDD